MSNIQTGAERMPHDLSHLGFLAGQIGRLITISTTPVIAGDSFEMDAVGALRLSPLRRGLAIDSTVDIFTFYVPHRHVYGEHWIKFMKDGVFFFQAEDGIRDSSVTGVQTCALPIWRSRQSQPGRRPRLRKLRLRRKWLPPPQAAKKEKRRIFAEISGSRSHGRDSFIHSEIGRASCRERV